MSLYLLALSLIFALFTAHNETPGVDASELKNAAQAISEQCAAAPLPGLDAEQCVAVVADWAWHESRFDAASTHDHGQGLGLFGTHHATLGHHVSEDATGQTFEAVGLFRRSLAQCASHPLAERLAGYASGYCDRRTELSSYRLHEAARLLREVGR